MVEQLEEQEEFFLQYIQHPQCRTIATDKSLKQTQAKYFYGETQLRMQSKIKIQNKD